MERQPPIRVDVYVEMSPRVPARLRAMAFALPAFCNLVDAMDGAPFRFYCEDHGNLRVTWSAEKAA